MSDIGTESQQQDLKQIQISEAPSPFFKNRQTQNKKKEDAVKKEESLSNRLKLKDYLRLKSISKRSNSNSSKRQNGNENKNKSLKDEQKPIIVIKKELIEDLKESQEKLKQLIEKCQKFEIVTDNPNEQYEELIFLCQLDHLVKDKINNMLDKSHNMVKQHKNKQMMKYAYPVLDNFVEKNNKDKNQSPLKKKIQFIRATQGVNYGLRGKKIVSSTLC